MKSVRQMKKYRVKVNLSRVYNNIKGFKLREFSSPYPTMDITAKSPDHVCVLVKKNLLELLKGQKGINDSILESVSHKMSIKQIRSIEE